MIAGTIVKRFKSKKGNTVVIRYPTIDDLDDMLVFANALSREDTFVQLAGEKITKRQERKYLCDVLKTVEQGKRVHLVATVNGKFAANCGITFRVRRQSHVGDLHISVAKDYREEGIGKELMHALVEEAKKKGLKLLVLTCIDGNDRAIHVYKEVGFREVGMVPGAIWYHEGYRGEVVMYLPLA